MTEVDYSQIYLDYAEEVNASLPEGTPPEERMRIIDEAIKSAAAQHQAENATAAGQDLTVLVDAAVVESGATAEHPDLAQIRASLE